MRVQGGARIVLPSIVLLLGLSLGCGLASAVPALLAFKSKITSDPHGILEEWSEQRVAHVCEWPGITCTDGRLTKLVLANMSLQGPIAFELTGLTSLETIDLGENQLSGSIPESLWTLKNLTYLDLRRNQLSGFIPSEVEQLVNLRLLNLAGNQFTGSIIVALCNLRQLEVLNLSRNSFQGAIPKCISHHPRSSFEGNCLLSESLQNSGNCGSPHRLLGAKPGKNETRDQLHAHVRPKQPSPPKKRHSHVLLGVLFGFPVVVAFVFTLVVLGVYFYKRRNVSVSPWKAGMSGHLQKVFVTDVPSVSWTELQAACEDFSNIIGSSADSVVFKGTLANGTEVAVTSIRISSASWTASSEVFFRRKIEALARMKHTHLVNLLGYCAQEEPFARMLLFEYAPNGTLSEHLHNEVSEHLDWDMRMRIVMGAAYGLEYMHHELVPPSSHSNFDCNAIYLTEDYAAKLADFGISRLAIKSDRRKSFSNSIGYDDFEGSDRHAPDFECNVFSFGLFLLEVVTGRLPYTDKEGSLLEWAIEYLGPAEATIGYMVDPTLKSFDMKQLMGICEVVRLCIQPDSSKRPTMKSIVSMLSKELHISPDAAAPKTSPLLWAELEILSESP